jgi:prophage antirepressor-like protein
MTQSVILSSHIFGVNTVRVFGTIEEPWFAGIDVAICLGYSKGSDNANGAKAIRKFVSEENQKCLIDIDPVQNDHPSFKRSIQPGLKLINEFGLYELILKSKKDEAKVFQKWVTSEVLPSIRKTGKYSIEQPSQDKSSQEIFRYELETHKMLVEMFSETGDERDLMMLNDRLRTLTFNSNPQITASGETEV